MLFKVSANISLKIADIIGDATSINDAGYYRFIGSVTVPPCPEEVIWNVGKRKIPISQAQVKF